LNFIEEKDKAKYKVGKSLTNQVKERKLHKATNQKNKIYFFFFSEVRIESSPVGNFLF